MTPWPAGRKASGRAPELLAAFEEAEADLEVGQYADYTEAMLPQLARELRWDVRLGRDRQAG